MCEYGLGVFPGISLRNFTILVLFYSLDFEASFIRLIDKVTNGSRIEINQTGEVCLLLFLWSGLLDFINCCSGIKVLVQTGVQIGVQMSSTEKIRSNQAEKFCSKCSRAKQSTLHHDAES